MRHEKIFGGVLVILFLFLQACDRPDRFEKIDSDILVKAFASGGNIEILAITEKQYPCANYGIKFSEKVSKKEIVISFRRIIVPAMCLMAIGPAKAEIPLGQLEEGEYDIIFELNNTKNTGKLFVGPEPQLELGSEGNVKPF
jgi:hypothetical protein